MRVHFSSQKHDWATPWELFRYWDGLYGPCSLDVCAMPENAKCIRYFSLYEDGLTQAWDSVCWMNPPYGRAIGLWINKAVEEVRAERAKRVVCLLPARTDTAWWHDLVLPYGAVHFLRGRVTFQGAEYPAPFPSAIVIFNPMTVVTQSHQEMEDVV